MKEPKVCRWCNKKYKKQKMDGNVKVCPHCKGVYPEGVSPTVYKDVWFDK